MKSESDEPVPPELLKAVAEVIKSIKRKIQYHKNKTNREMTSKTDERKRGRFHQ